MISSTFSCATQSAQALHLICCMKTSLYQSFGSKREWPREQPLENCITENFRPLDPHDPGLELLAKISAKNSFGESDLMGDLRRDLYPPLESPMLLLEHAHALLQLKLKPGGWLQVEAIWEHFTGASLTNAQEHLSINDYLDPATDFTNGYRYSVKSTWYQEADDDQYYHNPLPETLFGNDLTSIFSRLERYAERCDVFLEQEGQKNDALEGIGLVIWDDKDEPVMSLTLTDHSYEENRSEPRFDTRKIRIYSQRYSVLYAIKKVYGQHGFLAHRGKEFTMELGI